MRPAWLTLGGARRALGSYGRGFRASARLGRSGKLQKAGRLQEALATAREGLGLLDHPSVLRNNPTEASVLVCLTMVVEQLAHALNEAGADERDLRAAYAGLVEFRSRKPSLREMRAEWLPYLHQRLGLPGDPPA